MIIPADAAIVTQQAAATSWQAIKPAVSLKSGLSEKAGLAEEAKRSAVHLVQLLRDVRALVNHLEEAKRPPWYSRLATSIAHFIADTPSRR